MNNQDNPQDNFENLQDETARLLSENEETRKGEIFKQKNSSLPWLIVILIISLIFLVYILFARVFNAWPFTKYAEPAVVATDNKQGLVADLTYKSTRKNNSFNAETSTVNSNTTNWKTAKLSSVGLSFKYPSGYSIDFQSDSAIGFSGKSATPPDAIAVSAIDSKGETNIEKWFKSSSAAMTDAEPGATTVRKTYAGIDGLLAVNDGTKKRKNFYFIRGGRIFLIKTTRPDLLGNDFDIMMETLSFTK